MLNVVYELRTVNDNFTENINNIETYGSKNVSEFEEVFYTYLLYYKFMLLCTDWMA